MTEKIKPMVGLLGGAFDPVHNGHLFIAEQAIKQLELTEVQFIPCHISAYQKNPTANPMERLKMLQLATQYHPNFSVNDIELKRSGVSYSIDTLKALENSKNTLCFIIGFDSLLRFSEWREWQDIIQHCHLIVVNRPNHCANQLNSDVKKFHDRHYTKDIKQLQQMQAGFIYHLAIKPCEISSSTVRHSLQKNNDSQQIPQSVKTYIKANHLYPMRP